MITIRVVQPLNSRSNVGALLIGGLFINDETRGLQMLVIEIKRLVPD
jgi:hypothetical protein